MSKERLRGLPGRSVWCCRAPGAAGPELHPARTRLCLQGSPTRAWGQNLKALGRTRRSLSPAPCPTSPQRAGAAFLTLQLSPPRRGKNRGTSCSLLPAASGTKQGSPWQSWGEHQTLASVPRGRRELAQIPPPLPRELFPSRNRASFFQGEPSSRARGWRRSRRGCLGSVPLGARLGVLGGSKQGAASPSWPPNAPNYQSCELSEP